MAHVYPHTNGIKPKVVFVSPVEHSHCKNTVVSPSPENLRFYQLFSPGDNIKNIANDAKQPLQLCVVSSLTQFFRLNRTRMSSQYFVPSKYFVPYDYTWPTHFQTLLEDVRSNAGRYPYVFIGNPMFGFLDIASLYEDEPTNRNLFALFHAIMENNKIRTLEFLCEGGISDRLLFLMQRVLPNHQSIQNVGIMENCRDGIFSVKFCQAVSTVMRANKVLKILHLCGNMNTSVENGKITDKTAEIIAQGLGTNSTLAFLDLSGNNIGNSGLAALASAMRGNNNLYYLSLDYNSFTQIQPLCRSLFGNDALKTLKLSKKLYPEEYIERLEEVVGHSVGLERVELYKGDNNLMDRHNWQNRSIKEFNKRLEQNAISLPCIMWPSALEKIAVKPTFVYKYLKKHHNRWLQFSDEPR
jgi:hypothetical protein